MTDKETQYVIQSDIRFGPLEKLSIPELVAENTEPWFNQSLCRVNDCVARVGIIYGEFHWHHHDLEDEFFYVVSGRLLVDLEDRTETLEPGEGIMVPKGVRHRTRAPEKTVMLMFEGSGIVPTGDPQ
jgi:mannose-6-phosphate isomerase-like protein (cupin superfamily)